MHAWIVCAHTPLIRRARRRNHRVDGRGRQAWPELRRPLYAVSSLFSKFYLVSVCVCVYICVRSAPNWRISRTITRWKCLMAPLAFGLSTGCAKCETSWPRAGRIMPRLSAEGSERGIQAASLVPSDRTFDQGIFFPPAAAYTHNHIYIMNNSKHALTINQPDNNQLLKCYNI
jgi:hypothetical protein